MVQVYLVKRYLQKRQRNGQREYRWALRWEGAGGWKCESTGTADKTRAETLRQAKWDELNGRAPVREKPATPEPALKASWEECNDALQRAMEADNLRPKYIEETLLVFDVLRRMFPDVATPADFTAAKALEFKRRRGEAEISPWTIKGELAKLRALFGKWLVGELGLLTSNPFAHVKPPKCDDPDVRIVTAEETASLFAWLEKRWNLWQLPLVYLEVAALLGWRATETASIREEDLLPDGFVRVAAENCKTRRHKYGWLPSDLYADLKACSAGGMAFGRFADDLRRLHILWRKRPSDAARVMDFSPDRFVQWMQDELTGFHESREDGDCKPDRFSLHDFRRTAITGLQMAGVSEKEASLMVGATPEVIRKHYEKLDAMIIAKRAIERRLAAGKNPAAPILARPLRAKRQSPLAGQAGLSQTDVA